MLHRITVLPQKLNIRAEAGRNLLEVLREAGLSLNAPCGGSGTCGKCKVLIDGNAQLACHTTVDRDMTVTLPETGAFHDRRCPQRAGRLLQGGLEDGAGHYPKGSAVVK